MISNYIDRIDAFSEDVKVEANVVSSALERLAGELRGIETANQKVRLAVEAAPENDRTDVDAAIENEKSAVDELPALIMKSEMEMEDLLKLLTIHIPQVFQEITHMLVDARNAK